MLFRSCAVVVGLVVGIIIGRSTEYYTSQSYRPTQKMCIRDRLWIVLYGGHPLQRRGIIIKMVIPFVHSQTQIMVCLLYTSRVCVVAAPEFCVLFQSFVVATGATAGAEHHWHVWIFVFDTFQYIVYTTYMVDICLLYTSRCV